VFHLVGLVGLVSGTGLAMLLAWATGRSLGLVAFLAAAGMAVLAGLAVLTKRLIGRDALVAYHHLAGIIGVSALIVWGAGQTVLPYLDLVAIGVGTVIGCGRIGCFLVGCCHGLPAPGGVAYRIEHARDGFPERLVGVPLFPVQLVEAGVWVGLVTAAAALVLEGLAGVGLAVVVGGYALARFTLESLRGDPGRPEILGWSEARWWAVVSLAVVLSSTLAVNGHLRAGVVLSASGLGAIVLIRRSLPTTPSRARVLAELSTRLGFPGKLPETVRTTTGLVLTYQRIEGPDGPITLHTLSRLQRPLSTRDAQRLARLLVALRHATSTASRQRITPAGVLQIAVRDG
jgi:hypothetical protein